MTTSLRLSRIAFLLLAALTFARPAEALDVATANAYLKRAESNLSLVNGAIGHLTSPPKGSAAKLAKMRLDQAFGDIEPAGKALAGVSGAGAAEAVTRYNDAVNLYNKLAGILSGKATTPTPAPQPDDPKPNDPAPTPAASGPKTVKLGYPHADNFKNTRYTLREVEGYVNALMKLLEEVRAVEDELSVDHRTTGKAVATIAEASRKAGFVRDGLAKIPANGEGVAEAKQRLVNANAKIGTADQLFKPLHAKLMNMINPANYPEFEKDKKRLQQLSQMYSATGPNSPEGRAAFAQSFTQANDAKEECFRIARTYTRLMEQKSEQGKLIESVGNHFLSTHAEFLTSAEQLAQELPAQIRTHLSEADGYAVEAVREQKPMYFNGGIPQRMDWATDKLTLLQALNPESGAAVGNDVDAMRKSLQTRADSLRDLIIRENKLPNDSYSQADRDVVIDEAIKAYKKMGFTAEVLMVRIPSDAWKRNARWTYSNGTWYFYDTSKLQVRLIVTNEDNAEQVIDHPINVYRDHESGDSLSASPLHDLDEVLQPRSFLLRSRVK